MGDARKIWLLSPDYGYDGLQEPWMAFEDEQTCDAVHIKLQDLPYAQTLKKSEALVWNLGKPPTDEAIASELEKAGEQS